MCEEPVPLILLINCRIHALFSGDGLHLLQSTECSGEIFHCLFESPLEMIVFDCEISVCGQQS